MTHASRRGPRMSCREFADFVSDFLDGTLPAAVRDRFAGHLERCSSCRQYLATYDLTVRLSRHAFDDETPLDDAVPDELVAAILDARIQRVH